VIVADTNLILYLLVHGEHTAAAESADRAEAEWIAPDSWRVECLNVLSTYHRAGLLTVEQACDVYRRAKQRVRDIELDIDPELVFQLSKASGRAGYDCVFVAVAKMRSLPLVTFDRQLIESFPETAIRPDGIADWFAGNGN
jgi:predicted nucleic acid-binding protein